MDRTRTDIPMISHEKPFFLEGLSHSENQDIQRHHIRTDYAKGSYITREGEEAKGLIWLDHRKDKISTKG